jgi:CheY-like chemotaxis protein
VLRQTFDVVLMDLQMPVMDGYEATRAIRGTTNFALLPIIALTANATELDRQRALDAGVNDYITKPFDPDLLLRRLHRWISRPGAEITQPPVP